MENLFTFIWKNKKKQNHCINNKMVNNKHPNSAFYMIDQKHKLSQKVVKKNRWYIK